MSEVEGAGRGPVPVEAMHHVGLQVADLERSLAFYRDLLGFAEVLRMVRDEAYVGEVTGFPGAVVHVAHLRPPRSAVLLELTEYRGVERRPVDTATANPGTAHTCYVVEDLEAVHADLVARGVPTVSSRVVSPPAGAMRGGKVVYVQDPDGIRVELVQLAPGAARRADALDELVARREIEDVLARYCRAVDRGDLELLRSVYHPDATDDHGFFSGRGWEFAEWLLTQPGRAEIVTQHHLTTSTIEVDGDEARAETYFVAHHHRPPARAGGDRVLNRFGGRYLDRLSRRGGEWRIAERRVVHDWSLVGQSGPSWDGVDRFAGAAQAPHDASYDLFGGGGR